MQEKNHKTTLSRSVGASLVAISIMLILSCGLGVYWVIQDQHYPAAEHITGVGKCGSVETYHYGRSFRFSTQRCLISADSRGDIAVWYQSQGYQWLNDGQVQLDNYDSVIDFFRTERVYILQLENDQRDIRIYTDYTIRLP